MTASATSFAVPGRPRGSEGPSLAARSGSRPLAWSSVSMMPGRTTLTLTFSPATSLARPQSQGVDGSLRGGVVDVLARGTQSARGRGDQHDRAALPAVAGRHASNRFSAAQDRRDHVHLEQVTDAVGVDLVEAPLRGDDARVGHQPGHGAELGRGGEQTDDVCLDGHIRAYRARRDPEVVEFFGEGFGSRLLSAVAEADRPARFGRPASNCRTDTSTTTGHDQHPDGHHYLLSHAQPFTMTARQP